MGSFTKILSIITIIFSLVMCIIYWNLTMNTDYLTDLYPKIGAFIACHGGLIGSIIWLIKK